MPKFSRFKATAEGGPVVALALEHAEAYADLLFKFGAERVVVAITWPQGASGVAVAVHPGESIADHAAVAAAMLGQFASEVSKKERGEAS